MTKTTSERLRSIVDSTKRELEEDYVEMREIVADVEEEFPRADMQEIRRLTLRVVADVLKDSDVALGNLDDFVGGAVIWRDPDPYGRLIQEWNVLDRLPDIGEVGLLFKPHPWQR